MPIYEYECRQCGRIEEIIQKFSDAPLTTCKNCSGTLSKLISHSSFHLKGAGWFADGYGNKSGESPDTTTPKDSSDSTKAGADSTTKASAKQSD